MPEVPPAEASEGEASSAPEAGGPRQAQPFEAGVAARARAGARAGAGSESWSTPWPEQFAAGAGQSRRARLTMEFATAIRRTGALMQLMGQAAADRIGINATDLNCLNILSFAGRMTAGELARATGLTTASITGVTDRLEQAGFVRRERDAADRRRVMIQLVADRALSEVAPVFGPMLHDLQQLADGYTDGDLRLIVDFYGRMEQVFRVHLALLRGIPPGRG